jgi:transposase InsO family protein
VNRFQFVYEHARQHGVKRLCRVLGLARSSYYYWLNAAETRRVRREADAELAARIRVVHCGSHGTYGAPRITAELNESGATVNHKRVARVMREQRISGVRLRRRHATTIADQTAAKAPDLLSREFTATEVNTKYVGDITYLPIEDGTYLYLATVMDLASRRLTGWAVAEHMRTDLVIDALTEAERTRGGLHGAIFHTDHGTQYTSKAFAAACQRAGVTQSMGKIGSSADNAAAEALNAAFKRETLQGQPHWKTTQQARLAVFGWAHRYNTRRRHSHLGQLSPINYENTLAEKSATLTPTT